MMKKRIILMILVSVIVISCRSRLADFTENLPLELNKLSSGKYIGIAWVSNTTLVLAVDKGNLFVDQRMCSQQKIIVYDLGKDQSQSLPTPFGGRCNSYVMRSLQVLPNQQAGYMFEFPKLNSLIIKSVNVKTLVEADLYNESPGNTFLNTFSYSPDMKQLLVVDVQSPLLESSIYILDLKGAKTNLTADFLRADFPVWSQKDLIAFFGTKPYLGSHDDIDHFSQLEERVNYPWRLYLYNPQSQSTEELPLDIVNPSSLRWSPDGEKLAFSGEYKGIPGVWVVDNFADPDKLRLTRIVDGLATFDFSPDGTSIAFVYIGLENTDKQNILYMVDLNPAS